MFGVPLSPIAILNHEEEFVTTADKFLADHNKWSKYLDGREKELEKLRAAKGSSGFQNRDMFRKDGDLQESPVKAIFSEPYGEDAEAAS